MALASMGSEPLVSNIRYITSEREWILVLAKDTHRAREFSATRSIVVNLGQLAERPSIITCMTG